MAKRNNKNKSKKERKMKSNKTFGFCNNIGNSIDNDWSVDIEIVKGCSIIKKHEIDITDVLPFIKYLIDNIEAEWQMFLTGTEKEYKDKIIAIVDGYYIPKQEVTAGSVTNEEDIPESFIRENNIIATIHSHADMGVGFSQVDIKDTVNSDIKYHIVTNNRLEFCGKVKVKLPCGYWGHADLKVIANSIVLKPKGFENIKKKTFYIPGYPNYGKVNYGGKTYNPYQSKLFNDDYGFHLGL